MTYTDDQIILRTAWEFGVTVEAIKADTRRSPRDSQARAVAMYLCRNYGPTTTWTELGRVFNRDRTSVRAAVEKVRRWARNDAVMLDTVSKLILSVMPPQIHQ